MKTPGEPSVSDDDLVEGVQFLKKFFGIFHEQRSQPNSTSSLESSFIKETIRQLNAVLDGRTDHRDAIADDNSNLLLQYIERISKKRNRAGQNIKTRQAKNFAREPVRPLMFCNYEEVSILPQKVECQNDTATASNDPLVPLKREMFPGTEVTTWGIASGNKTLNLPHKTQPTQVEQKQIPEQRMPDINGCGRKKKSPNLDRRKNECAQEGQNDQRSFLSSYNFGQRDSARGLELPSDMPFSVLPRTKAEKPHTKLSPHCENVNQMNSAHPKAQIETPIGTAEYKTRSINYKPSSARMETPLTPPDMWNLHFS